LFGLALTSVCLAAGCENLIGLSEYSVAEGGGQNSAAGALNSAGGGAAAGRPAVVEAGAVGVSAGASGNDELAGSGGELTGSAGLTGGGGSTGSAGLSGTSGATGSSGASGAAGSTGSGGSGGSAGSSGSSGRSGSAGSSGSSGSGGGPVGCLQGCDDSNDCTDDSCVASQCVHQPLGLGVACNIGRTCDAQNLCVRCRDTAPGTGRDTGCLPAAPVCLGTGLDATCGGCATAADCSDGNECTTEACQTGQCVITPVAAGQACTGGVCNGLANSEKCVACADTAAGAGQDAGCSSSLPVCDSSATPACRACVQAADCASDNVSCTVETCSNHVCSHVATDSQCAPSGDVCKPNKCDLTLGCKQVDVTSLVALITADAANGNGSFEAGMPATTMPAHPRGPATGWSEGGVNWITNDCANSACNGTVASAGTVLAWFGGDANAGVQDLRHLLSLLGGTTKLHIQADTNLQTASRAGTNHDLFQVRLLDSSNTQIGATLFSKSNADAQIGPSFAWTPNGIDLTVDVSAYAGKDVFLSFWSSNDTNMNTISNFFVDNVRVTATVCK
jgi:hypothetical protein